jgi:hypothetical protein
VSLRTAAQAVALGLMMAAPSAVPPPAACPEGFFADPPRSAALASRLASVPEGASLVAAAGDRVICFGKPARSVVTLDRQFLLEACEPEAPATARLGHLMLHLAEGSLLDGGPVRCDCNAWVDEALGAEARALSLEIRLRRALGAGDAARYAFEAAYWEALPAAQEGAVLAFLRTHPHGGGGVDALAAGYARRCRERALDAGCQEVR